MLGYNHNRMPNYAAYRNRLDNNLLDMHLKNAEEVGKASVKRPVYILDDLLSDDITAKEDEAQGVITSLAVKYIMGRITMDEYDKGIESFVKTYGYMLDEYTNAYEARYIYKD